MLCLEAFSLGRSQAGHLAPDTLIKRAAGDVRFNGGILGRDLDGDGSADFSIVVPAPKALKAPNLLLTRLTAHAPAAATV